MPSKKKPINKKKSPVAKNKPKITKKAKKGKKAKKSFSLLAFFGTVLAMLLFFVGGYMGNLTLTSRKTLKLRMEGKRFSFPSKIYSLTRTIYPGMFLSRKQLVKKLKCLGYRKVKRVVKKGEFSVHRNSVSVYTRGFKVPPNTLKARKIKVVFNGNKLVQIKELTRNKGLAYLEFEPELLAVLYGVKRESRKFVPIQKIPKHLIDALITTEDRRFYTHFGIDPRSVLRAMLANIKAGKVVQGGSTLTQQLAKNFFLTPKRTLKRKVGEAVMAVLMEYYYSKEQILECYLNEVYWGQKGSIEIHGVGEASTYYFDKNPEDMTLAECATLAAIIKGPQIYSPYRNKNKAIKRRNIVLGKMKKAGIITEQELKEAKAEKISLSGYTILSRKAPYFIDFLKQQLIRNYSEEDLEKEGLHIFTTLDPNMQEIAENTLKNSLKHLEKKYTNKGLNKANGCIVVLQPQTGYILALVGGKNYIKSQFNRATQAKRQVGSILKPMVYLSAIQSRKYTTMSLIENTPLSLTVKGKLWQPRNFTKTFSKSVTLREALEHSINIPTVRLGMALGFDKVLNTAKRLGIKTKLPRLPSLFLGAVELTPLEVLSAYGTIANYGVRAEPITIKKVTDKHNKIIKRKAVRINEGVDEGAAFITVSMLKGVVEHGTGRRARAMGFTKEAAGKTGTTSKYRDAWFVGFTSNLACLTWVGRDDYRSIHLTGSQAALPIWAEFMKQATKNKPQTPFIPSEEVVELEVDRLTGFIANENCPDRVMEYFITGTEPTQKCTEH